MPGPESSVQRHIALDIPDGAGDRVHHIEMELDSGRVYHAMVAHSAVRQALIERLVDTGCAAIVPPDGGLIGNLKVWENLVLPAAYHGGGAHRYAELEQRAADLFAGFGISGTGFDALCTTLPDHLTPFEQRLCGFVRAMLTAPRIMVYDSLFDGLSRDHTGKVLAFDRVYHSRQGLPGTSLHLTADLPTLPDLGAHGTFHL